MLIFSDDNLKQGLIDYTIATHPHTLGAVTIRDILLGYYVIEQIL